jgi:hypothetical protein
MNWFQRAVLVAAAAALAYVAATTPKVCGSGGPPHAICSRATLLDVTTIATHSGTILVVAALLFLAGARWPKRRTLGPSTGSVGPVVSKPTPERQQGRVAAPDNRESLPGPSFLRNP